MQVCRFLWTRRSVSCAVTVGPQKVAAQHEHQSVLHSHKPLEKPLEGATVVTGVPVATPMAGTESYSCDAIVEAAAAAAEAIAAATAVPVPTLLAVRGRGL